MMQKMKIQKLHLNGKDIGKAAVADNFIVRHLGLTGRDFGNFDAMILLKNAISISTLE